MREYCEHGYYRHLPNTSSSADTIPAAAATAFARANLQVRHGPKHKRLLAGNSLGLSLLGFGLWDLGFTYSRARSFLVTNLAMLVLPLLVAEPWAPQEGEGKRS